MTELTMFDSVDVNQIPGDAQAVAGYVNGRFQTVPALRQRFPRAHILTIAVNASADADALDIETGDATPAQAAAWFLRQKARGVNRPCLYASASVMDTQVIPALDAAGIGPREIRLWSAHYTHTPHVCGPSSCRELGRTADGTQFTDRALGRNLDQSLLLPDFFGDISTGWTARMIADLPTLQLGAKDTAGHVFFVSRLQALAVLYGELNEIAAAACLARTGTFDGPTKAAVQAIQAHKKIAVDGIAGRQTWSVLIAGNPA